MVPRGGFATKPTWRVQDHLSQKKLITFPVREGNRRNSVFETELRLTFSPIFRNDAMALVGSQGHHPVDQGLYIGSFTPPSD